MAIHAPITGAQSRATLLHPSATPIEQVLSRFDRQQLEAFLTVAIDLLDTMDGDADLEEDQLSEANGDEHDVAWCEPNRWTYRQFHRMLIGRRHEDDEEDDDSFDPSDGQEARDYY